MSAQVQYALSPCETRLPGQINIIIIIGLCKILATHCEVPMILAVKALVVKETVYDCNTDE